MQIASTSHTETHWVFIFDNGESTAVGKYKEWFGINGELCFEGVETEAEALEILVMNNPDLEL